MRSSWLASVDVIGFQITETYYRLDATEVKYNISIKPRETNNNNNNNNMTT
jgi:hypothetical protein